tara:strand:- start:454 stop:618 length:165 start_codon:yes stop_codon:yes gene_type:complete
METTEQFEARLKTALSVYEGWLASLPHPNAEQMKTLQSKMNAQWLAIRIEHGLA